MVWLGGPRRRSTRGLGGGLFLNDPPPGYRPPRLELPFKQRQRQAREEYILMRGATVILVGVVAALVVTFLVIIALNI